MGRIASMKKISTATPGLIGGRTIKSLIPDRAEQQSPRLSPGQLAPDDCVASRRILGDHSSIGDWKTSLPGDRLLRNVATFAGFAEWDRVASSGPTTPPFSNLKSNR